VKDLIALQHNEMVARLRRGKYDDVLATAGKGAPPCEEPPLDLAAVESVATQRRERANTPPAGRVGTGATPPPSSARASAKRLDHARLAFREHVPTEQGSLDELIVEQIAAYLAQDE
jgi:hypothetical protein